MCVVGIAELQLQSSAATWSFCGLPGVAEGGTCGQCGQYLRNSGIPQH
jgi:hypothetical protein